MIERKSLTKIGETALRGAAVTSNVLRKRCVLVATLVLGSGCFASHGMNNGDGMSGPATSTETGNPPAIDAGRVALEVSMIDVHITGDKGAVSPGGSAIEITNLATGIVTTANAASDGSFDVSVDGSSSDTFAVRAKSAGAAVYVVRGTASVSAGGQKLSCSATNALVDSLVSASAANIDVRCVNDDDCNQVLLPSGCSNGCDTLPIATRALQAFESTIDAIHSDVCKGYGEQGCVMSSPSCVGAPPSQCQAGKCVAASTSPNCYVFEQQASQLLAQAIAAADRSCMVDTDCVLGDSTASCSPTCDINSVVSQAGASAISAAIDSIERGVCASFAQERCMAVVPPCLPIPNPGERACLNGQCGRTQQPSCPPDRKYATVCTACGPAGGCTNRITTCAKVCSDDMQCAGDPNGPSCSSQNVCETSFCE